VTREPAAIVQEYFARVRAGDREVAELFREHATIRGLGMSVSGRANIRVFYDETMDEKRPDPELLHPLTVDGKRVIAELRIAVADGPPVHVLDLFEIEQGQILRLTYFMASYPSP